MLAGIRSQAVGETLERLSQRAGPVPVAGRSWRCDNPGMCSDPASDRLWIELDRAADPICGAIHRGAEPVQRFHGWLELVALLESQRGHGDDPRAPRDRG
jgi:hypothetical protein